MIKMCEKPGACDSVDGSREKKTASPSAEVRGALRLNLLCAV